MQGLELVTVLIKKWKLEQCCAQAEGEVKHVHGGIQTFAMPVNIVTPPSLKRVKAQGGMTSIVARG